MTHKVKFISFVTLLAVLCGCAAQKSDDGKCSLSCGGGGTIPGSEFKIKPLLSVDSMTLRCSTPDAPLIGPIEVNFLVYEEVSATPGVPKSAVAEGDLVEQPKGGVAFEPLFYGAVSTEAKHTNDDFKKGNEIVPANMAGVKTPRSEFCSDSCGVIRYQVWPLCIGGEDNNMVFNVKSGSISSDTSITVNVSNSTDEE